MTLLPQISAVRMGSFGWQSIHTKFVDIITVVVMGTACDSPLGLLCSGSGCTGLFVAGWEWCMVWKARSSSLLAKNW